MKCSIEGCAKESLMEFVDKNGMEYYLCPHHTFEYYWEQKALEKQRKAMMG